MRHQRLIPIQLFALLGAAVLSAASAAPSSAKPVENLTLDQALEMAERRHPQLAGAHALVEAAAGRAQQAGTLPNPELILGAQQLPLAGDASNQREYVAGVAQPIPLGGRLGKARDAELLEREVRARGLEITRRDLRKRVHSAFATALYQEQAFLAQSRIAQGFEKAVTTTKARVEAGDAVPEDLFRVEMDLARAHLELRRAESLREQSRVALAAAMGDVGLRAQSLAGSLEMTFEIPTLESLAANLAEQPESLQAEAAVRASNARIDLAEAERVPDVRVEALYHRLEATRENTLDLGLSIPLPLFNRNQGRLREARADAAAAEARARATQLDLSARLHGAHAALTTSLASSQVLKADILPRAETVLKAAEARYAAGDSGLGEVLQVRRDWAVAQLTYLESLRDVMQAWGELSVMVAAK